MPELSFYERQHIQKILAQQGAIGNIYNAFAREISEHLRKWTDTGKLNVWVRNASIENGIDRALIDLQVNLLNNLSSFGMDAWKRSQTKNDDIVKRYIQGMSVSSVAKEGMFYRNQDALKAMQNRVDSGMNLSGKVWKIVDGTKAQVEMYLSSGLSVGRPAGGISQDMRQLLHDPDKRFRRVRDENGKLKPSAPMADYHPGQGVYRSSYMNSLRLSSTETNINYRQADHDRWQKMDFVLGIEIKRSANNKGPCKVCDAMVGKYPKGFVFTGFHPFCICFAVPLMMDHEDFADYLLDDTIPSGQMVRSIPERAKGFVSDHYETLQTTYFVRDNKSYFTKQPAGDSFSDLVSKAIQLGINTKRFEDAVSKDVKHEGMARMAVESEIKRVEINLEKERQLYTSIVKKESEIRMNKKYETAIAFNKNGEVLLNKDGQSRQVNFIADECRKLKNGVMTHNHPSGWSYPKGSVRRIGNSLSEDDILMAVRWDLSEMRAVTPNYTFVLKRPEKGWGVTPDDFHKIYTSTNKLMREEGDAYVDKMGYSELSCDRASIVHFHKLNKRLAKMFGWEYSKHRD